MGHGDGSLFKNDRGGWTMFVSIDGRRYKRSATTKTEVRAKVSELRNEIARGTYEPGPTRKAKAREQGGTVADVVDQFLTRDLASRNRAPATVDRHRWAGDKIKADVGNRLARSLKVADVEAFLERLADDGMSRASVTKIRNTLSQSLRAAARREIVERDVARDAVIPPQAPRSRARRSLSPDHARALLVALRNERNGLAFALSLRLGLRPGESFGLYWVDIDDAAVNVTRGLRRNRGTVEITDDLKTESSRRTIEMPADLAQWIDEHRRAQVAERLAAPSWADDRLVFASPTGRPVDPAASRAQLAAICERAGITVVTPNELRHSCASLLSDEGVSNEQIADLLGHTTTRMVDSTYRHRLRPMVDVAATATWAQERS